MVAAAAVAVAMAVPWLYVKQQKSVVIPRTE